LTKNYKNFFVPLCGVPLRAFVFFIFSLLLPVFSFSQQSNIPLNHDWIRETEARMVQSKGFALSTHLMQYESDTALQNLFQTDSASKSATASFPMQTSMRPWIEQGHPLRKNMIRANRHERYPWAVSDGSKAWNRVADYHCQKSLLQVERPAQNGEPLFRLYIDPLLNLEYMNVQDDTSASTFYINTRGIIARGDIGTKVSFETTFRENQAFYPAYIRDFAEGTGVIPGNGRWKRFKTSGYDYASASGYISWSPCRNFNAQVGHGKFFVGDGYRSLLLSDNGFNYPFARLTGWFGPDKMFQYTAIYASLMNLVSVAPVPVGTERLFQKKSATFYQLAMKIGRIGEISLFQGLIWKAADDRNKQCLTMGYVNPVMFAALPAYGLNHKNNFLLGATFRFDLLRTIRLYGQFMLDDAGKKGTYRHKTGIQLGVKYFNAFTVKHLHLEFEFNQVSPYSYAASDSAQAYTHYNQPLAHPLGANFTEMSMGVHYKIGDFFFNMRYTMATIGVDTAKFNFGQDVFISDVNPFYTPLSSAVTQGQGEKTTLNNLDLHVGYMVSYASNFNIAVGYTSRNITPGATFGSSNYVYVALRTSLDNTYRDFFRK
jgi:hypothetical protein